MIRFDATLDRVADSLSILGDPRSKDQRRAAALGPRRDPRPPATLYVHLTDHTLAAGEGVARVEGIGPVTLPGLRDWLSNSKVTVKPVIDLNAQTPVDAYEIPDRIREAIHLISPVDCFPYATSTSWTGDIDHTTPYRPPDPAPDQGGPPGQTAVGNLGPMTRRHHRSKTFAHWDLKQVWPGVFAWRSPHGHHYLVDHTGTTKAQPRTNAA